MTRHTYTNAVDSEMVLHDGRYEIDWDDLEAKLEDPQTQSMIVCNPQNPTGNVWTEAELLKLGQMCLENDVIVLSDEIHSDFIRPGHKFVPFAGLPDKEIVANSISFNSGSKTFNMAGMKNAYWHTTNADTLAQVQHFHFPTVSTLGCVASEAAYRDGAEWLDPLLAYLDDNHKFIEDYVAKNMPTVSMNRAEGTYLTWLDFSQTMAAVGAAEKAAAEDKTTEAYFQDWMVMNSGVYLNPGSNYGKGGPGRMRFNVGSSRKVVKAALDLVAGAVNNA
jgi:cystathionine beta-lyase